MDSEHPEDEDSEVPNTKETRINQEQDANVNSTNNINTINVVDIENNATDKNRVYGCFDDPKMHNLEEIVYSDNDEEVGAETDMNNLATTVPVSPIPTTRVHKDHPLKQIIRDIQSAPQTRRMTKSVTEHAMQDELLQFKLQKVLTLVELPYGKRAIDYDEIFALVARIEAIRLFLAYASFMNFIVYQMDVKSAFLYGIIKEEVYVCQPPGFEDPEFPNKVYEVEKALYGLHQAPRAWKDKGNILLVQVYVDDIIFGSTKKSLCTEFEQMMHKRFQMSSIRELTFFLGLQTTSTPMKTNKSLLKDEEVADVDVHLYRSMIRSLMYLIAFRPDIMFVVCACARFQVTPKTSHLHVVKRIFRYLKGHPKLGLWYPIDSSFDLEAFLIVIMWCCLHRNSTTERLSFSWKRVDFMQCKKRGTIVANSNTKARTVIKEWEDRMERVATTASSLVAEQDSGSGPRCQDTILGVQKLKLVLVYVARHSLTADRHKLMLPAIVDKKKVIITEKSVRSDLMLEDVEGTEILPNDVIFEQLTLMGRKQRKDSGPTELILDVATNEEPTSTPSCDLPQSGEDRLQLAELITLCTKLQKQVLDLEEAKTAQGKEISKDACKKGRKIVDLDADAEVTLIDETQERFDEEMLFVVQDDLQGEEVVAEKEVIEKEVSAADQVTTAGEVVTSAITTVDELTLAQTLIEIKAAKPKDVTTATTTISTAVASTRPKAKGIVFHD
ncbi:putative ribonuclease H-like domain-containing protein [Tanacetum coccineum]|uniref:Ribonuclease H-like domain-containing protein n=1 Tax=Tanacetum coccineum TaxID=301880 RepID=A0ABQ4Y681_9ASTR